MSKMSNECHKPFPRCDGAGGAGGGAPDLQELAKSLGDKNYRDYDSATIMFKNSKGNNPFHDKAQYEINAGGGVSDITNNARHGPGDVFLRRKPAALVLGSILGVAGLLAFHSIYGLEIPGISVRGVIQHQGEKATSGGEKDTKTRQD